MKRVRHIYITDDYGRIDSDDPRLNFGIGLYAAAYYFGKIAARREYGAKGVVLEVEGGDYHRMKSGSRKHLPVRKAAQLDITGFYDYHVAIGGPAGCGIVEYTVITIPIRITRARGSREYYEEPAFVPPAKAAKAEPPLFRKR